MGKRKRKNKNKQQQEYVPEEIDMNKPWCFYCDREFDDEKILINHQKHKHFKCPFCGRKLGSCQGMLTHISSVHKENIKSIPNAIEGRNGLELDIYGMVGIPEDFLVQRYQKRLEQAQKLAMAAAQQQQQYPEETYSDDENDPKRPRIDPSAYYPIPANPVPPPPPYLSETYDPSMQQQLTFSLNTAAPSVDPTAYVPLPIEDEEKTIMVYDDEEVSMEEKRAMLPQYQLLLGK